MHVPLGGNPREGPGRPSDYVIRLAWGYLGRARGSVLVEGCLGVSIQAAASMIHTTIKKHTRGDSTWIWPKKHENLFKMYLHVVTTVAPLKFIHTGALRRVSCSFQWKQLLLFLYLTTLSDSQQSLDNYFISAALMLQCWLVPIKFFYYYSVCLFPFECTSALGYKDVTSVFFNIYINANQMFLSLYIGAKCPFMIYETVTVTWCDKGFSSVLLKILRSSGV